MLSAMFQYQYGPINTQPQGLLETRSIEFQYQYGPINTMSATYNEVRGWVSIPIWSN